MLNSDTIYTRNTTVIVTGASSGIGKASALNLAQAGCRVYAGVRKVSDKDQLLKESTGDLTPLLLDVTDSTSIDQAYELVRANYEKSAICLVNNAGLSLNGPLELLPMQDVETLINVNVLGLLAVTRKFLPLIRETRGRVVNISSGHGLMAIPDKSVYAASKFAVRAITDSLRLELKPFHVEVSEIVVGKVKTNVLRKILEGREQMINQADSEVFELYRQQIEYFDRKVKTIPGIEASEVARVISRALLDDRPKIRYLVGPGARKMKVLSRFPVKLRDGMLSRQYTAKNHNSLN